MNFSDNRLILDSRQPFAGVPLGAIERDDEYLHPAAASGHHSATETSYFGFNIPEHRLNAEIYMWFHPVLGVMSASVYIWRAYNFTTLECDYVNHYHFLPMPKNGIANYEIPDIGLEIKVIEPLKAIAIKFEDPSRGVSFDCRFDAIMPPAGRPNQKHFTQAMRTSGALNLYGEKFIIDGYFSRDRSWGEERRETSRPGPPISWMVGIQDDNFAFHVVAHDSPELSPEWTARYAMEPGKNLMWGYVWRDQQLFYVTKAQKLTHREHDGITPRSFDLTFEDSGGETHIYRGDVDACMPWQTWQNINIHFCLTRWQGVRGIAWGDTQDIQSNDFISRFARPGGSRLKG